MFPDMHHGYPDPWHPEMPMGPWPDRAAPETDDQLPIFSTVGRGLKGDSYRISVLKDALAETYLQGAYFDAATGTWASDWTSENINGGMLSYQYNLRPYTIPQTFTITFDYRRPNRSASEWTWTTPAIPYIWDADGDGEPDADGVVGVGVASLFIRKTVEEAWNTADLVTPHSIEDTLSIQEKLVYPAGWERAKLNAPVPGDPWTVNLTYGVGGDVDAPNVDDLAKLIGITVENIRNIIATSPEPTETIPDINLKTYIDRRDAEDLEHIHGDLGFGNALLNDDGTLTYTYQYGSRKGQTVACPTVKQYIDVRFDDLAEGQKSALQALVNQIVGGGTVNNDGTITWPSGSPISSGGKIAAGNLNVYGGDTRAKFIKTHANEANDDVWAR